MKVSTGYGWAWRRAAAEGVGEFVYFGESGGDDEHERALAGGERDAELALWGQHVIEGDGHGPGIVWA